MISICPAILSIRRETTQSCKAVYRMGPSKRLGSRILPHAKVGQVRIGGGRGREMAAGHIVRSAPAAASPAAWCQAMVQILSAPNLNPKLNNTRMGFLFMLRGERL